LTSQLPVTAWHAQIGDPTLGDSILDRIVHNAHPDRVGGRVDSEAAPEGGQWTGREMMGGDPPTLFGARLPLRPESPKGRATRSPLQPRPKQSGFMGGKTGRKAILLD